ncbi:general secretion pathway protein GspM [Thalassotalea sp. 42_200_T64]|nr:general secretion pathway protein GspM [Thalassotalea sp. 42_200_T64]
MKQWWQGLNAREQQLVAAMSVVVVIFLFITLVWQPINEGIEKSRVKLVKQQILAEWVSDNIVQYKQLQRSGGGKKSTVSLSSVVNRTAKRQAIEIARMQPQGDDLQVWIDEVEFNALLAWLQHLTTNEGVNIIAADIATGNKSGTVKVRRLQLGKA